MTNESWVRLRTELTIHNWQYAILKLGKSYDVFIYSYDQSQALATGNRWNLLFYFTFILSTSGDNSINNRKKKWLYKPQFRWYWSYIWK